MTNPTVEIKVRWELNLAHCSSGILCYSIIFWLLTIQWWQQTIRTLCLSVSAGIAELTCRPSHTSPKTPGVFTASPIYLVWCKNACPSHADQPQDLLRCQSFGRASHSHGSLVINRHQKLTPDKPRASTSLVQPSVAKGLVNT